jgi:hypothetical protein
VAICGANAVVLSATAAAAAAAEGGPSFGGYALSESRKVRLCKHEVPQSCLDVKSPDACVNQVRLAAELAVRFAVRFAVRQPGAACSAACNAACSAACRTPHARQSNAVFCYNIVNPACWELWALHGCLEQQVKHASMRRVHDCMLYLVLSADRPRFVTATRICHHTCAAQELGINLCTALCCVALLATRMLQRYACSTQNLCLREWCPVLYKRRP